MHRIIAAAIVLTLLTPISTPAFAVSEAEAFKLCVDKLASQFGVNRNDLKKFKIRLAGDDHYEIYGTDSNNRHVSCNVVDDRVKGIKIG